MLMDRTKKSLNGVLLRALLLSLIMDRMRAAAV